MLVLGTQLDQVDVSSGTIFDNDISKPLLDTANAYQPDDSFREQAQVLACSCGLPHDRDYWSTGMLRSELLVSHRLVQALSFNYEKYRGKLESSQKQTWSWWEVAKCFDLHHNFNRMVCLFCPCNPLFSQAIVFGCSAFTTRTAVHAGVLVAMHCKTLFICRLASQLIPGEPGSAATLPYTRTETVDRAPLVLPIIAHHTVIHTTPLQFRHARQLLWLNDVRHKFCAGPFFRPSDFHGVSDLLCYCCYCCRCCCWLVYRLL